MALGSRNRKAQQLPNFWGAPPLCWEAVPLLPSVGPSVLPKYFPSKGEEPEAEPELIPSPGVEGAGYTHQKHSGALETLHKLLRPCYKFSQFPRNSLALSRDSGTGGHQGGFQGLPGTFIALQDSPRLAGNSGAFPAFLCPFQEFLLVSHAFPGERWFSFPGTPPFPPLSVAPRHQSPLGGCH